MIPLVWMAGVSLGSWLLISTVWASTNPEVLFGMIGPLVATGASWVTAARTHAASPERVMGVLIMGFAAKAVFFGVYVAGMLRGLDVRPAPFVWSFTGYFIALYAMEALFLKRLFGTGPRGPV